MIVDDYDLSLWLFYCKDFIFTFIETIYVIVLIVTIIGIVCFF